MESINRNKASMRVGAFHDAAMAAQGDPDSRKAHIRALSKLTGTVPMDDSAEFKKDFAGGI